MNCDIVFHNDYGHGPKDKNGCHMPRSHGGLPHEFVADDGITYQWETDLSCDCEHCMKAEGDYCTTYWPKERTTPA